MCERMRNGLPADGIGEQTWNRLFNSQAIGADAEGDTTTDGKLTLVLDSSVTSSPELRVYLVSVEGQDSIVADMPEQPAGEIFSIDAPAGLYYVYARSLREGATPFAEQQAVSVIAPAHNRLLGYLKSVYRRTSRYDI